MPDSIINFLNIHREILLFIAYKVCIALIIIIAGKILIAITAKCISHIGKGGRLHIDETLLSLLRVILKYGIVVLCIIMLLGVFGINTAALVAVLGTAGVAIGLALKDTLGNIASGIMLLVLQSYRKGDFIEFNSFMGTVTNFDLFTTTLETPDGVFISAPNSSIWAAPVKNYSRNPQRRMDLSLGISYRDSLDRACQVMQELVDREPRFLKDPKPQIMLQSLGESSVTILLRAWAPADVYWELYWKHLRLIKEKMAEAGIAAPLPQRELHIVEKRKEDRQEPS